MMLMIRWCCQDCDCALRAKLLVVVRQPVLSQGTAGCQETAWTREAGGYLRQILNARVYDVAVSLYIW